jgi:hypothetical protein
VIDWLTLKVDAMDIPVETVQALRLRTGRVIKLSPDGAIEWETVARESIRSDSHQVTVAMGGELSICGSPARVMQENNVFGSGDPILCARAMLAFVRRVCAVELPDVEAWRCTRMDVTCNYDLGTPAQVREALMSLRHAEGGRYQLRTCSESVYWSVRSQLRAGKAYHKGPHLEYQQRKGQVQVSDEEVVAAGRLLRLELSLKSQWWRERSERKWFEYSESELEQEHEKYFAPLIGGAEVTEMDNMQERCAVAALALGLSEGQGKAAYLYWLTIGQVGFETARSLSSRTTHYRNVKVLREAGLSFSDFQARRVVSLRRRPLVLAQPVRTWEELRRYA